MIEFVLNDPAVIAQHSVIIMTKYYEWSGPDSRNLSFVSRA